MELTPICPHCGCNLIFCEYYNSDVQTDEVLYFADGYCPKCQRKYHWIDVYTLNHIKDLKEVKK